MAQKNRGPYSGTSVSLAFLMPSAVASITTSSFSVMEFTSEINGQVWECTVPTAYAEKYAASYNTSNLRNTSENQTILRIVGDRPPMENAVRVQPTLEDLYLFYFKGGCEE